MPLVILLLTVCKYFSARNALETEFPGKKFLFKELLFS